MDNKHLAFPWLFVRMSFSNVCFPSNFLFCGFFCFYTVLMEVALSYCNAGDPSFIPGSRRSPGEGIGYPLQYCWASPVAQLVKNPPAMWGTWVQSLGSEDPLEKGQATHSSILTWKIPWTVYPWGHKEWDTTEGLSLPLVLLYLGAHS